MQLHRKPGILRVGMALKHMAGRELPLDQGDGVEQSPVHGKDPVDVTATVHIGNGQCGSKAGHMLLDAPVRVVTSTVACRLKDGSGSTLYLTEA